MNRNVLCMVGLTLLAPGLAIAQQKTGRAPAAPVAAKPDPAEAVRSAVRAYVDTFNKRDVKKLAECWAKEAVYVDRQTGQRTVGRAAIAKDIEGSLKESPAQLAVQVEGVRFIKPDVAQVDGKSTVVAEGEEPTVNVLSAVLVNEGGKWLLDSVQEIALATPPSSTAALQELAWLVGKWKDDTEGVTVTTTVRWSAKQAFLIRSYTVQFGEGDTHEGTQVIGWDPKLKQIRSWTFDSDGSFGEESWSKTGDEWTVKLNRTLDDGRTATGLMIITRVDDNSATFKTVGREVDGEPAPSTDAVRVVRVPEQGTADIKK